MPVFSPFRTLVDKLSILLGWPVIMLGVACLGLWSLGSWFRKIANQSADFCERIVEAQFAAHTKNLKSRRREQDVQFLSERVIDPELLLRSSDDRIKLPRTPGTTTTSTAVPAVDGADQPAAPSSNGDGRVASPFRFEDRELAFLRNVRLLYQDYLDGSPLHRSDTKASIQLLGNLALANLRRSHLRHYIREGRLLDRLDLSRAGGLFGGPYLWFNYITRLLVQETALLILDYNRHAIPVDRLACSPEPIRARFRSWIATRLEVDPDDVWLPDPPTPPAAAGGEEDAAQPSPPLPADLSPLAPGPSPRLAPISARPSPIKDRLRRKQQVFLETVEFTSVDFLADDPERDAEIRARFGPQVAELVRRDRQQNVRRAFRSFPLHELPLSSRTINPFALYESYIAGGRVLLLPFHALGLVARAIGFAIRGIYRVVGEILHPRVDQDHSVPADTYWAALRKIHRMRKPVFMGSLWLRARFDVEYLGLPLPTAPADIAAESLMETDLDYIGATRQDRIIAEQVRRDHQVRLEWTAAGSGGSSGRSTSCPPTSAARCRTWSTAAARRSAPWWPPASWTTTTSPRSPWRSRAWPASWPTPPTRRMTRRRCRRASPSRSSACGRSGTPCTASAGPSPACSSSPASPSTTPSSGAASSFASAATAAPSAAGSASSWARAAPTPGRPSASGCATSCSAPTSGATRSSCFAPSRPSRCSTSSTTASSSGTSAATPAPPKPATPTSATHLAPKTRSSPPSPWPRDSSRTPVPKPNRVIGEEQTTWSASSLRRGGERPRNPGSSLAMVVHTGIWIAGIPEPGFVNPGSSTDRRGADATCPAGSQVPHSGYAATFAQVRESWSLDKQVAII